MLIAFEGPDEVGKSTSASNLSSYGSPIYNATKDNYAEALCDHQKMTLDGVITFDRIDWFSHMVYRLALPTHEWNDDRPRTVFAMPETHLVLKLHHPTSIIEAPDEPGYNPEKVSAANEMYYYQVDFLMRLNKAKGYSLFKSVSIVEVVNDQKTRDFSQELVAFDSPVSTFFDVRRMGIRSDIDLLELLRDVDRNTL